MKKKIFAILKQPMKCLFIFLVIGLIWDIATKYNEYTLTDFIKSIVLGIILIWAIFSNKKTE
jgi:hypothetical protein